MIQILNFAYLRDKEGTVRALPPDLCDVIAILHVSDLLRRKWVDALKFFRDGRHKVDAIFRVYYPVYMVRQGGKIIPVDGLGRTQSFFNSNKLTEEFALSSTCIWRPVFGPDMCGWLMNWQECSMSAEEVMNGYVIPPAIQKEEALRIASEFATILESDRRTVEAIEERIKAINEEYNKKQAEFLDKYRELNDDFDRRISLKNMEIEGLETYRERNLIREVRAKFEEKRETIKNDMRLLEEKRREIFGRIMLLKGERERLLSSKDRLSKRMTVLKERLSKILNEREELKNKGGSPKEINENIKQAEKVEREIEGLGRAIGERVEKYGKISEEIEGLEAEIGRIDQEIKILSEKEELLPSKEEEEIEGIRKCFTGRRNSLIRELVELIEEKERSLMEIRARENEEKGRYEEEIRVLEFALSKARKDCSAIESVSLPDEAPVQGSLEMIYIPFYIFLLEKEFGLIEPQIFLREGGKLDKVVRTCLVRNGLSYLQGNWEALSVLLFKAKDTFNLLSTGNRRRIISAAETLRSMRGINDFQLAYIRTVDTT